MYDWLHQNPHGGKWFADNASLDSTQAIERVRRGHIVDALNDGHLMPTVPLQHIELKPTRIGPGGEVGIDLGLKVTNDLGVPADFVGLSWVPYLEPAEGDTNGYQH